MTDTRISSALTDDTFADFILKPHDLADIWSKSRPKDAILERLQVFFKPRSSFEVERVDYNA